MSINPDDYSPAATIITFPNPIPLLRQPILSDNNSLVLSFPNPDSFVSAYTSCEQNILDQCLEASRVSCMKFAEDKCLPAFRDARIVVKNSCCDFKVRKSVFNLISSVCFGGKSGVELGRLEGDLFNFKSRISYSISRGSDVIGKEL